MNTASPRRLLLLTCLLALQAAPARAGFSPPRFSEQPLVASTFYGAVSSMLPFMFTSQPGEGSEMTSSTSDESDASSSSEERLLRAAREDAAMFVASAGAYRGARLEAALRVLRQRTALPGDDLQLAQALLAGRTAR